MFQCKSITTTRRCGGTHTRYVVLLPVPVEAFATASFVTGITWPKMAGETVRKRPVKALKVNALGMAEHS